MAPSGEAREPARAPQRAFRALAAERDKAEPLSQETRGAAELRRTAKAAGARVGPSTRRPAGARFAVGAGARRSRPARRPHAAAHAARPPAPGRPAHRRLESGPRRPRAPGPVGPSRAALSRRALLGDSSRKFENEGEKQVEF